jgi:hypothetical protein
MGVKGCLQFDQITPVTRAINGFNFLPVGLHGQYQTPANDIAIETHSARAADAMFTTEAGGFKANLIPNKVSKVHAWFDTPGVIDPVKADGYFNRFSHLFLQ